MSATGSPSRLFAQCSVDPSDLHSFPTRRSSDLLALVLLAGAGLMLRTVAALTHASAGFDPDRILSLQFSLVGKAYAEDSAVVVFQDQTLERLRAIPGVAGVALAGQIPFAGNYDC